MPLLNITNLSPSIVSIQDPTGASGLSLTLQGSATLTNHVLSLQTLQAIETQLDRFAAAGTITWFAVDDPDSVADGGAPGLPYSAVPVLHTIYARATGSDTTGDGRAVATAFRTLVRAVRSVPAVPAVIPDNHSYDVDCTNLGTETLPDGYRLPAWRASDATVFDATALHYPIKAAVNITAAPRPASNVPLADTTITAAELVSTTIGGGIADVVGFNDDGNAGTGNGTTDEITVDEPGVAKLVIAGETFDYRSLITIAGSANPLNDGTFVVVNLDGDAIYWENPDAVAEAGFAGTYAIFTPHVLVETNTPHGLWHSEGVPLPVTVAGIVGSIGTVANGEYSAVWRTTTTFVYEVSADATALVYTSGGTVETLFVQDPVSGNVQVKTTKTWPVDVLVGKLFISAEENFEHAVIYKNTANTLFLSNCFAPGLFGGPITSFQVMEQSAELITTCTFEDNGSRRGPGRGGFTAANIDSLALNGIKITPANPGEIGLLQYGGTLVTQGCHLTKSRFRSAVGAATSLFSYIDDALHKGSPVDMDRCFFLNMPDPARQGPSDWFYAYFGTVFKNVLLGFDTDVEQDLFACKWLAQEGASAIFFQGRNTWDNVSFENNDGYAIGVTGQASRNRLTRCNGTVTPGNPHVLAVNGGVCMVSIESGPYGDGSFTRAGDYMTVDGLPDRTFADWRAHALLDMDPLTSNLNTVFEAISAFTSSPVIGLGDPPYPSIQTVGDSPLAGGVIITYNDVTGLVLIRFEAGVSTVLNVETAVTAFTWPDAGGIRVKTPGTAANVLVSPGDVVAATPLTQGVYGPSGEYTNIRHVDNVYGSRGTRSSIVAY